MRDVEIAAVVTPVERPVPMLACRAMLASAFSACAACVPMAGEGAPVTPSLEAPHAPSAPDIQVVTPDQASDAGLTGTPLSVDCPDDGNGASMVEAWLAAARRLGSHRVGAITVHVVRERDGGAYECRTSFGPRNTVEAVTVPGHGEWDFGPRPVQRVVTHLEQRCQMVSKPHMRMETTYTSQYDSFSKSFRSVPQTRSVTDYRLENECRLETVSRMETQWQYGSEWRYTPPRTEFLDSKRLVEAAPVCDAVDDPSAVSRVEGIVYR